jgi:GGDEF domain-containing protein
VISLKNLFGADSDRKSLCLEAIAVFLNATALRAVDYDSVKYVKYQSGVRDICVRSERARDVAGVLLLAEEAAKLTDEYNRGLEEHLRSLNAEKQSALGLMIEGFITMCAESNSAAQNLRFIERELDKTSRLQDVRVLKKQMADCLQALACETARQEKQTDELRRQIDNKNPGGAVYDPVTGLAGALPAENYIRGCTSSNQQMYVLLLVVKSLDVINRRYGYLAGDRIMALYTAAIAARLPATGRLFRWHGPSLVAAMLLPESASAAHTEAARVAAVPSEYRIEQDGNSVFPNVTASWLVLPILRSSDAIGLSERLDEFVRQHGRLPELPVLQEL